MPALFARMRQSGNPARQAAALRKAIDYLNSVRREDTTHIMIASHSASRSACLCFATFTVDLHPLIGVDEQGVKIMQHFARCDRNSFASMVSDIDFGYVSKLPSAVCMSASMI
jgi:hypothetical protein